MMEDFNRAPVLIEVISTDPLNDYQRKTIRVGDQFVVARHYATMGEVDGSYRIVKTLPKDTPYGEYNGR